MSKEYSETLGENIRYLEVLGKNIRYKKEHIRDDLYRLYIKKNEIELLENYLEQEQIKNAKSSKALDSLEEIVSYYNEPQYELGGGYSYKNELLENCGDEVNTIKQALLNKSKKEKTFEEIQSIIDTWHTSHIMDNETALREIDKIICEALDNDKRNNK